MQKVLLGAVGGSSRWKSELQSLGIPEEKEIACCWPCPWFQRFQLARDSRISSEVLFFCWEEIGDDSEFSSLFDMVFWTKFLKSVVSWTGGSGVFKTGFSCEDTPGLLWSSVVTITTFGRSGETVPRTQRLNINAKKKRRTKTTWGFVLMV